jgi:hypothetical protein
MRRPCSDETESTAHRRRRWTGSSEFDGYENARSRNQGRQTVASAAEAAFGGTTVAVVRTVAAV